MADSGVGGVPNGCGPESKWEKLTRAVCGNSGKTKSLKVDVFVSSLVKFIADISMETAIEQIKEFKTNLISQRRCSHICDVGVRVFD